MRVKAWFLVLPSIFMGKELPLKKWRIFIIKIKPVDPQRPYSYGLNSKLVKNASGKLEEKVWKSGGMYGA